MTKWKIINPISYAFYILWHVVLGGVKSNLLEYFWVAKSDFALQFQLGDVFEWQSPSYSLINEQNKPTKFQERKYNLPRVCLTEQNNITVHLLSLVTRVCPLFQQLPTRKPGRKKSLIRRVGCNTLHPTLSYWCLQL